LIIILKVARYESIMMQQKIDLATKRIKNYLFYPPNDPRIMLPTFSDWLHDVPSGPI
jgi:hypothetical protein